MLSRLPQKLSQKLRWPDGRLLWLFLGLSGLLLLTLKLSSEVIEGDTQAFDRAILIQLRAATGGDGIADVWLRRFMLDITALGDNGVLAMVALVAVGFPDRGRQGPAGRTAGGRHRAGRAASALLKLAFGRARPDVVAHLVSVDTASFPSGHAMNSAVVYLTMAVLLARGQEQRGARVYIVAIGVLLTLMIGLSRLYLGVHWPTDVLVGWVFGASWAMLIAMPARACRNGARWSGRDRWRA